MRVKAWSTTAIGRLFGALRGRSLVRSKRIKTFEDQTTVIAEQLMQAKHSNEKDCVVVIALNPLAMAPRTLHAVHSSRTVDASRDLSKPHVVHPFSGFRILLMFPNLSSSAVIRSLAEASVALSSLTNAFSSSTVRVALLTPSFILLSKVASLFALST